MQVLATRSPSLPLSLSTDRRTAKRKECLADVGPFVVPNAQAPELIQPRERSLDDPALSPQAATMCRAAHCDQWPNGAMSATLSNCFRIVAAIRNHAIWAMSGPSTFTVQ